MRLIFKPPTIFCIWSKEWETKDEDFHASVVFSFCSFCAPGLRLATVAWQPSKLLRVLRPTFGSLLKKPRWSSFFQWKFCVRKSKRNPSKTISCEREWSKNERAGCEREGLPGWSNTSSTSSAVLRLCWLTKLSFRNSFLNFIASIQYIKMCSK